MNRADVIRLAAEAAIGNHLPKVNGLPGIWAGPDLGPLEQFAALIEAEVRKEMEVDAARYQALRRGQHWSVIDGLGDALRAEQLDAAIDRSIRARTQPAPGGAG